MERTWTTVGKELSEPRKGALITLFDGIEWKPVKRGDSLAMGIAMALNKLAQEFGSFQRYAMDGNDSWPFHVIAFEKRYKNGLGRVYVADTGCELIPLASDLFPKEAVK